MHRPDSPLCFTQHKRLCTASLFLYGLLYMHTLSPFILFQEELIALIFLIIDLLFWFRVCLLPVHQVFIFFQKNIGHFKTVYLIASLGTVAAVPLVIRSSLSDLKSRSCFTLNFLETCERVCDKKFEIIKLLSYGLHHSVSNIYLQIRFQLLYSYCDRRLLFS